MSESVNHTTCEQCNELSSTLKTITDNITVSGTGPTGEYADGTFMPPTDKVYGHWINFTAELSDVAPHRVYNYSKQKRLYRNGNINT